MTYNSDTKGPVLVLTLTGKKPVKKIHRKIIFKILIKLVQLYNHHRIFIGITKSDIIKCHKIKISNKYINHIHS